MPETPNSAGVARALEVALAELEQTRWTLTQTQRLARLGSWERDITTGKTRWSDETFRIYGLPACDLRPSKELGDYLTHPEDLPLREVWLEEITSKPGTEIEQTLRIRRQDGMVRLVLARGTLLLEEDGTTRRMIGTVQDVTEETSRRQQAALLSQIVQSATEAIITIDVVGNIKSWNPAAEKLYGFTAEEMIGNPMNTMLPDQLTTAERQVRIERQRRLLSGRTTFEEYEESRKRKDGTVIEIHGRTTPLLDDEGTIVGLVTNHRDITDRRRAEERVAHLASHDVLTGLFNRHRFEEELAGASARAEHEGYEAAMLTLDLDNFKAINDTYGRYAGDEILKGLAGALRATLRSGDVLARTGGDSFCVLTAPASVAQAQKLAERLLLAIRDFTLEVGEHTLSVSASAGVVSFGGAPFPKATATAELLADADRALYESKESGRNRFTLYSTTDRINGDMYRPTTCEHVIREALKHNSFELYSQPIVRLSTGVMSHVEILLRLRRDDTLLTPEKFLPGAERQGLIHLVDYWVISHAFEIAAQHPDLTFDINLSGATVDDSRLESYIAQELRNSGVNPRKIVFELTETAAIGNIDRARGLAQSLNNLGCRFAIDDFGAGFSTFYYLKHFPADYLKIDGEFVSDARSQTDRLVIQSIVRLAEDLGKETIAEYVSDAQTFERVRDLGVDFGQGYHFAKPFPVADLAKMPRLLVPESAQAPTAFRTGRGRELGDPERLRTAGV